jgi:hypothetical protein
VYRTDPASGIDEDQSTMEVRSAVGRAFNRSQVDGHLMVRGSAHSSSRCQPPFAPLAPVIGKHGFLQRRVESRSVVQSGARSSVTQTPICARPTLRMLAISCLKGSRAAANLKCARDPECQNAAPPASEVGRLAIRDSRSLIAIPKSRGFTILYASAPLYALSAEPMVSPQGSPIGSEL